MNVQGKARGETIFIVSDHPKLVNSSVSKQSGVGINIQLACIPEIETRAFPCHVTDCRFTFPL